MAVWGATLLAAAGATSVSADEVVILVSEGAEAYELAFSAVGRAFDLQAPPDLELRSLRIPADSKEARRFLERSPDAVLAVGARAARFARKHAPAVPLVYSMVLNPEAVAAVEGESGAPVGGVTMEVPLAEQFRFIRQVLPEGRRIGVLFDPSETHDQVQAAREAASAAGLELVPMPVRSNGDVLRAARVLTPDVDAFWAMPDPTVLSAVNGRGLILHALRARKPVFAVAEGYVRRGALAAICADPAAVGARSADLVLEFLDSDGGRSPRIEPPPAFHVYVNTSSADRLGLAVPHAVVGRARKVFPE